MALKIYDTLAPQGNYPAVNAADVAMPDGTRLSDFSGSAGQDGLTPYIGSNGNWWIGETDTGTKAQGEKGDTGATGAKGDAGAKGDKGDKGDPGQDAPQTAILYTSQSLSTAQKLQARQNIDAASATDMENEIDRLDERISGLETAGEAITVDSELSATSTNPVQNKVITAQMNQAMLTLQNVVLPSLTPTVSAADNGKFLRVVAGAWAVVALANAEDESF